MTLPPILLGGPVHLPLQVGMTSTAAIQLANQFYLTQLAPEGFKETQAFVSPTSGLITLDLLDLNTDEVLATFVNKSTEADAVPVGLPSTAVDESDPYANFDWDNAFSSGNPSYITPDKETWLHAPTQIAGWDEVDFFDVMQVGVPYPTEGVDNNAAYRLAQVLNTYGVKGGWASGTLADRSTAGFELVYKGASRLAPVQFNVPESSKLVIFKTHYGDQQGFLCLWI